MTDVQLFPGTVTDVTPPPYTGNLSFSGVSASPWDDATTDSTRASLETNWDGSDFVVFTRATALLPALDGTPTGLVAHMRAYTTTEFGASPGPGHLNVSLQGPSGSPYLNVANESPAFQHWPVAVDSVPQDYVIDLGSPTDLYTTWGTSQASIVSALQTGTLSFVVQVDVHTPHVPWVFTVHIAALWLEAVGVSAVAPSLFSVGRSSFSPLRQHPRSDGLGSSSVPRVYPSAPSIQASNRRAGGYL